MNNKTRLSHGLPSESNPLLCEKNSHTKPLYWALGDKMRLLPGIALALLLAGCTFHNSNTTDTTLVGFGQLGPVRLGMSQVQIADAIKAAVMPGYTIPAEEQQCYYVSSDSDMKGIGFMMDRDRLVRIDVWESTIRTSTGIGIGSTIANIATAYPGPIEVTPHQYTDGHYLVIDGPDKLKMLFETDISGTITQFRTGRDPAVRYVEGCL